MMRHRNVTLEDGFGDRLAGVERVWMSDEPPTITVNGTCWYTTTWTREGWSVVEESEWLD
jgi:hypothetical protein